MVHRKIVDIMSIWKIKSCHNRAYIEHLTLTALLFFIGRHHYYLMYRVHTIYLQYIRIIYLKRVFVYYMEYGIQCSEIKLQSSIEKETRHPHTNRI